MMYLAMHLVEKVALEGLVFCRWMYPIERNIQILKSYIRNMNHPEGSIAKGYLSQECIDFSAVSRVRYWRIVQNLAEKTCWVGIMQHGRDPVGNHYFCFLPGLMTCDATYLSAALYIETTR